MLVDVISAAETNRSFSRLLREVADSTAGVLAGAMDLCVDHQLGSWDAPVLSVAAGADARLLLQLIENP
ncbi:hypothetical protein [Aphanothece minutissima]|uniref:Uncharacterized protein n=1 Tax=Aphanothece cf. minutissima CCALA 015 TaxID=2107695 RepID=A0ABX5F645_9CHRO|nr:hypothetical protein [Aphanothece minutissima]PSB36987.1 hypothetical protein C7B81_11235 [Aphanothece cf. minutissima CCALA 015]